MHRLKRALPAALALFILLSLCACADERPAKLAALSAAVTDYHGSYFALDDLAGQMEKQTPAAAPDGKEIYTFTVRVPDYASLDAQALIFEMPTVDYDQPDAARYREEVFVALSAAAKQAFFSESDPRYTDASIQIELNQSGGAYTASLLPSSAAALENEAESMLEGLLAAREGGMQAFSLIEIAEKKAEFLSWIFEDAGLVAAVHILEISEISPGCYAVGIRYPNLVETYAFLGERAYADCADPIFKSAPVRLAGAEEDAEAFRTLPQQEAVITVRFQGAAAVPESDAGLWLSWYEAKAAAEKETRLRIESKWLVTEKSRPRSGAVIGKSAGNEITLTLPEGAESLDCYAEFYPLPGGSADAAPTLGAYIRSGSSAKFELPDGTYELLLHWGKTWYGPEYAFGADDIVFRYALPIESLPGKAQKIPLDLASDGMIEITE